MFDLPVFSRRFQLLFIITLWIAIQRPCSATVTVLTQHNNNARNGANLQERTLTAVNVNAKLWQVV